MFLTLMVVGLVGLVMMAIPAFGSHGHAPPGASHGAMGHGGANHLLGAGRGATGNAAASSSVSSLAKDLALPKEMVPADHGPSGVVRFIPSPRAIFSVLTLYGAFGNALFHAGHLAFVIAATVALVPALLVERFAVRPIWNLVFRFQGEPSAPLETLVLCEATAVTPFRNGKGIISVVREGRRVQFSARLREEESKTPIMVGDQLRIEDVEAKQERFIVSALKKMAPP